MTTTTSRPPAAESGEDKLIAVARHIARTIGRTDTMTDDIIQIFSNFDRRFSREKLEPRQGAAAAERRIRSLERKVSMYMSSPTPIWSGCESEGFLRAVDGVIEAWREGHASHAEDGDEEAAARLAVVEAADGLLHRVMLRLEDEFRILIDQCGGDGGSSSSPESSPPRSPREHDAGGGRYSSSSSSTHDAAAVSSRPAITDHNLVVDFCLPWGTMSDLYEIARRMSAAGYGKACALAYSVPRLASLREAISRLGFQHHWTTEEVHARPWPELAEEIRRWTHAARVAFRVLFPGERRLCDRVFPDALSDVADLAFADVCRDPALGILGFADAVAVGSKAPERLFAVVEMYETLRDLVPDVDALFVFAPEGREDGGCRFVRSEAATVCARLGLTVRGMLAELEGLVRRDPPTANKEREALPGGGVHPITRYVLNYLRTVSASARTLEEILQEEESAGAAGTGTVGPSSALAVQVAWITEILVTNLEEKSKAYRDPALGYVFLMNNGRYLIQKAKGTELGQLLGDDWLLRQSSRLRQWHGCYQKASWSKLVAILQQHPDGDTTPPSSPSAKLLRSRFRRFNVCLEELCDAQAGWVVADEQLRAEIRISAVGMVLPAYRNFLGRVKAMEAGRQQQVVERCVKYAPEDVEARINAIFQGSWKKP